MGEALRIEERGGDVTVRVVVCNDCGAWCRADGEALKHSRRCDTPDAQPEIRDEALTSPSLRKAAAAAKARSAAEVKRLAREGSGLTPDEAFEGHRRGLVTANEAMNRDD